MGFVERSQHSGLGCAGAAFKSSHPSLLHGLQNVGARKPRELKNPTARLVSRLIELLINLSWRQSADQPASDADHTFWDRSRSMALRPRSSENGYLHYGQIRIQEHLRGPL
jgi:hypothetical protein